MTVINMKSEREDNHPRITLDDIAKFLQLKGWRSVIHMDLDLVVYSSPDSSLLRAGARIEFPCGLVRSNRAAILERALGVLAKYYSSNREAIIMDILRTLNCRR